MPKGNVTPQQRANQRLSLLDKQAENTPADYSMITKLRRKVKEFLGSDDGQLVTTMKRRSLMKKLEKLEDTKGETFRSQKNISEQQSR